MSDSLQPMNCSMPGFPVLHHLPEFAQTYFHWVSNVIQPSHPLSPSSLALSLPQHQGLFQWVSSSHQMAKLLQFQLQQQTFQWIFRIPLGLTGLISLLFKRFSRVFSNTTVQKCSAFLKVQLLHPYMTAGKTIALTRWTFVGKVMSLLFNMLSRLVITFLPRSKRHLISCLQVDKT